MSVEDSSLLRELPDAESPTSEETVPSRVRALFEPEELRSWREPNGRKAAAALALIWAQIGGGLALYLWLPGPATFAIAFCIIAGGQHGLALAGHEFVHYSILPRNRARNDLIGSWLFAAPVGLPLTLYRHRHFLHHRFYGTARDTKTVYRREVRGPRLFLELFLCLSGCEYVYRAVESISRDRRDLAEGLSVPGRAQTLPPIVAAQAMIFAAFCLVDPLLYFGLWILPLVTAANLLNKMRALMEHRPLDSESGVDPEAGYFRGTPGPYVRTVTPSLLERLFLSKLNFGYHVEHHLWPQLSYQALPLVRERLLEHRVFEDGRFGFEATYLSTILKLWRPQHTDRPRPPAG